MAKKSGGFLDVFKGLTQKKGTKDKEIEKYEKILSEQPDDRNALNMLGDLYAKRGVPEKAFEYYLQVGELYARDGFTLKAIAVYKKAQRAKPRVISTYLSLADLYVQKGLIGEAKSNYLTAAEMQASAGEKHESLDTYRKIADLDPNNINIRSKLAAMYENEDFVEDAAIIYSEIGDVLIKEDIEKGKRFYQRAIELQADNQEILSNIGYSYADLDLRDEAIAIFRTLLKLHPKNIDYQEQLEILKEESSTERAGGEDLLSTAEPSIEFSEEELGALNFGEDTTVETPEAEEPLPVEDSHTLDFDITGLTQSEEEAATLDFPQAEVSSDEELPSLDLTSENHSLDFHIEQEDHIAWEPEEPGGPAIEAEHVPPTQEAPSQEGNFFDLASKLDTSVSSGAGQAKVSHHEATFQKSPQNLKVEAPETLATSEIGDIIKEFKQGVLEEVGAEDFETHYELGISYKEMSLLDDAIEELKLAALEPSKFVECQSVIGLCFIEKGDYSNALKTFEEARKRVPPQGEKYQDLTYQIAVSYEQAEMLGEAAQVFQELYQVNPGYRDVKRRLNKLLA